MRVGQVTCRGESCFHGVAEVDADDRARAPTRCELSVPAFAASALKDEFAGKEIRLHRRNPTQKLFGVALVVVAEVLPGPTKVGGGGGLVQFDLMQIGETRNAAHYGEVSAAAFASQLAFKHLVAIILRQIGNGDDAAAGRAIQIL